MSILEIISGGLLVLCSVCITLLVCAQQPKNGMGTLAGGDNAFGDMRMRSSDGRMAKVTGYAGIGLFALSIAVSAITIFVK